MFAAWRKWRDKERVAKTRVLGFMGLWDGVLWSQDDWIREQRPVQSSESREWSATRQLGRTTHRHVGNIKLLFVMAALESGQLMNHHRAYLRRLGLFWPPWHRANQSPSRWYSSPGELVTGGLPSRFTVVKCWTTHSTPSSRAKVLENRDNFR